MTDELLAFILTMTFILSLFCLSAILFKCFFYFFDDNDEEDTETEEVDEVEELSWFERVKRVEARRWDGGHGSINPV